MLYKKIDAQKPIFPLIKKAAEGCVYFFIGGKIEWVFGDHVFSTLPLLGLNLHYSDGWRHMAPWAFFNS